MEHTTRLTCLSSKDLHKTLKTFSDISASLVCHDALEGNRHSAEQLLASVLLKRDLVTRENLKELVDTVNKLIAN